MSYKKYFIKFLYLKTHLNVRPVVIGNTQTY